MRSPGKRTNVQGQKKQTTSWGSVADWYHEHLTRDDTYHAQVIVPHLIRVVGQVSQKRLLDVACGEGIVTEALTATGANVEGSDIAAELVAKARQRRGQIRFHVADARSLTFARDGSYDIVTCVLALQNMEQLSEVFRELSRILTKGGRLIMVLNHPAYRIPKRSSWAFDAVHGVQYRRLDGYYSESKEKMVAHPGAKGKSEYTWSFHRPLEHYMKSLFNAGFVVSGFEEWLSHRVSEKGPKAKAEDKARREFPLFLMIESTKLS